MACSASNNLNLSHKIRYSLASSLFISKSSHALPSTFTTPFPSPSHTHKSVKFSTRSVSVSPSNTYTFTWDDVVRISQPDSVPHDSSDLSGFFQKVKICNRGSEKQSEFLPFVIEDQIAGYIHNGFANHLRRFKDVFIFPQDSSYGGRIGSHVTLHPMLRTPDDRTNAVGDVVKFLGEELIPGIRNELYPVTSSFGAPIFFSLERAAAPYFGIKAYGVHMNGYVDKDGQKLLWIGKRSQMKATYPGMLDHLAAGGLPYGIACGENLVKECEEEAGIPKSISKEYKRDVLFCYDLKLPASFRPENQDGEVDSFKLIPVTHVANVIQRTQFFKPNCSLVIIDFLFRHGYMSPEHFGYLDLLQSLRSGDCS
ncbi:nudix hydrolase 20 [Quercus suber]|uniref:Nudix hydrolase 20 n=1 Tax=Quercus suber TaxID=58331 RepID=A0AAW0KRW5_QUESU